MIKKRRKSSTDGPERIAFEQRRISEKRYESIPRRESAKHLFAKLTPHQQAAYDLIEEAHGYQLAGLPAARMKYSDAPGGYDWELTPKQMQVLLDYREWRGNLQKSMPAVLYAVLRYMADDYNLSMIESALRVGNGKAVIYISKGLNEYCLMKGWGEQEKPPVRKIRITGFAAEITHFLRNMVDEFGRPVADFRKKFDKAGG